MVYEISYEELGYKLYYTAKTELDRNSYLSYLKRRPYVRHVEVKRI